MWRGIKRGMFQRLNHPAYPVSAWLLAAAGSVSGIESPWLAIALASAAVVLMALPHGKAIRLFFRQPAIRTLPLGQLGWLILSVVLFFAILPMAPLPPRTTSFGWALIFLVTAISIASLWIVLAFLQRAFHPKQEDSGLLGELARANISSLEFVASANEIRPYTENADGSIELRAIVHNPNDYPLQVVRVEITGIRRSSPSNHNVMGPDLPRR